jgi:hypothetical protein
MCCRNDSYNLHFIFLQGVPSRAHEVQLPTASFYNSIIVIVVILFYFHEGVIGEVQSLSPVNVSIIITRVWHHIHVCYF